MIVVIGDLIDDVVVLGASRIRRGTDNPVSITHARGGSAANVAAATAGLAASRFIGRVGDDAAGEALVRRLARSGVDVRVQRSGRTGSIVLLIDDDGERTMLTDRAAAAELGAIDPSWLEGAEWLHLPLYGFLDHTSAHALFAAAEHVPDVPVSIDLSSTAAMEQLGADGLRTILARLRPSVVFANADEAAAFGALGLPLAPPGVLVVKRGSDPVRLVGPDGESEVPIVPADGVVDSTGAGDAFAAGYLAAAVRGASPAAAARAGADRALDALGRAGAL